MRRIPELDGLRALAASAILLFHLNPPRFFVGWTGVDLFFVLSGYLITSIILRNNSEPQFLRTFYIRRGLRIWPVYYLVFLCLIVANPWLPKPERLDAWPYYATYTQNLPSYWHRAMPPFNPCFDHTWTLAIEEQFYLVWPALVALVGPRRVGLLCCAVIALSWKLRAGGDWFFFLAPRMSERLLLARGDGFALGGLLAWFLARPESTLRHLRRLGPPLCALLALGAGLYLSYGMTQEGPIGFLGLPTPSDPAGTILAVDLCFAGVIGLVLLGQGHPLLAPLRFAPLVYLGRISYGLYMYHYVIYYFYEGQSFPHETSIWRGAMKIALTFAVAALSWHVIEQPLLSLKDHFDYRARPGLSGLTVPPSSAEITSAPGTGAVPER
jgi:peptidoglycan/LPS O-acetylase OafA/YrhL